MKLITQVLAFSAVPLMSAFAGAAGGQPPSTPTSEACFVCQPVGWGCDASAEILEALNQQSYGANLVFLNDTDDDTISVVTLTAFQGQLRRGNAVFAHVAPGTASGPAVEAYGTTPRAAALRDTAYARYVRAGWGDETQIKRGASDDGNFIDILIGAIASQDTGFVSSESIVYIASCYSYNYAWAWTGRREYLGYEGGEWGSTAIADAQVFWNRMNGENGKSMRSVGRAVEGCTIGLPSWCPGNTVLAPTVVDFAPCNWTFPSKDSFYCTVHFDCLMDVTKCGVRGDETYCYVDSAHWENDTTLVFKVHGMGVNGTGQVLIDECGVASAGNGTCLDGNTDPGGTDGRGPNGDAFAVEYYFWDNPAACVGSYGVVGGDVVWRTREENGTLAYRLLGSNDGREWEIASDEVPAQGPPGDYAEPLPAGWDYLELQEKEEWYRGPRWIDHDICVTNAPSPSPSPEPRLSGPPWLHVIGLEEDVEAIQHFIEQMADAQVQGSHEIVTSIDESVLARVFSDGEGDTLRIIWPRPDGRNDNGESSAKGGRRWWGVGLVGPEEYESVLTAYKTALENPIHWPPGEGFFVSTYFISGVEDSATICAWINGHGGEYWVLFGRVLGCNQPDSTTMPCAYFAHSDPPVSRDCCFSLWDWECGSSDTVEKFIGYVPVDNESDVWDYYRKMVSYRWNNEYAEYGCRLGTWAKDTDAYHRSGDYVHAQMMSVLDDAHPGWEVDSLWASCLDYLSGARRDSALAALAEGRAVVALLGTYGAEDYLCSFLGTSPGSPSYADVRAELANTYSYTLLLATSCNLHSINYWDNDGRITQDLLLVPYGGAVGSIGPSSGFYQDYYHMYLTEFMETYNEEGGDGTIGQLHMRVRNKLLRDHPDDPLMPLFCKVLPILGDPTIQVGGPKSSQYLAVNRDDDPSARGFTLAIPVPNPFNPTVALSFSLSEPAAVQLRVYDVQGRLVRTLVDRRISLGEHQIVWDGKNESGETVGSGVYFCRLVSGHRAESRKIVLLR